MIRYEAVHATQRGVGAKVRPTRVVGHRWGCDKCKQVVHTEPALDIGDAEDEAIRDARVQRIKYATENHVCRTEDQ